MLANSQVLFVLERKTLLTHAVTRMRTDTRVVISDPEVSTEPVHSRELLKQSEKVVARGW